MNHPDAARAQITIRQLAADANDRGEQILDLMPVRMPLDACVLERNDRGGFLAQAQRNALVVEGAVTLGALKRIAQYA